MYYYDYRQQPQGFFPGMPGGAGNVNRRIDQLEREVQRMQRELDRLDRRVDRIERRLGFGSQREETY
ncbi:hypothetical protein [Fredinandcohnia quinoae]|uniref:Uncharacterized protein n=1 Tax=Fredinandcohnia quinoae TaxID=2918902 RepID=A0AAW5E3J6_9BACI|nr:hypothetical protein [Fredinandcohnia sp. SECRCQ15]MCH1625369.1 hypothetical protein [Fredinandcohnia sp. SECRCQ15]